jgi:hypothetical protein
MTLLEEPRPRASLDVPPMFRDTVSTAEQATGETAVQGPTPYRRVILSSTLDSMYSVLMPIATEAWNAVGWQPTILLVGTPGEWVDQPAAHLARRFGADLIFIPRLEGFADSTVAQVARLFPHQFLGGRWAGTDDTTYAMTGDIDMIPLDVGNWAISSDEQERLTLWYGNAYPAEPPRYPLCNIGAECGVWREVMEGLSLEFVLRDRLGTNADPKTAWNFDELLAGEKIRRWRLFASRLRIVPREGVAPLRDRADRVAWPKQIGPGLVDAHLPRPATEPGNRAKIVDLLRVYHPTMASWVPDYLEEQAKCVRR